MQLNQPHFAINICWTETWTQHFFVWGIIGALFDQLVLSLKDFFEDRTESSSSVRVKLFLLGDFSYPFPHLGFPALTLAPFCHSSCVVQVQHHWSKHPQGPGRRFGALPDQHLLPRSIQWHPHQHSLLPQDMWHSGRCRFLLEDTWGMTKSQLFGR